METSGRGYGESDKCVCSGCIGDEYLVKIIRGKGEIGACSFCKDLKGKSIKHRKVFQLEKLMEYIMPAIDYYYIDALDGLSYESKEGGYMGDNIDHYDFIHNKMADEMIVDNEDLLQELYELIEPRTWSPRYIYGESTAERDMIEWDTYTRIVNKRKKLSVEQIISLCKRPDAPDDIKMIHTMLNKILYHARKVHSVTNISTGAPFFRCVNYLGREETQEGYNSILATQVGTAPACVSEAGRFNEKGDMMFYGASNEDIAIKEVGKKDDNPFTIGKFFTNKRISVLNLCTIEKWKQPSFFRINENDIERRESWFFLKQFILEISKPVSDIDDVENYYKPIQVFTKYMQRVTQLYGIEYRSSKSERNNLYSDYIIDRCYVLFAENRDCMDESERSQNLNKRRLQLFMREVWQKD